VPYQGVPNIFYFYLAEMLCKPLEPEPDSTGVGMVTHYIILFINARSFHIPDPMTVSDNETMRSK